jgi:hypothetical protein
LPQGTITAPAPGGPLDETKSGPAGGDAMKPITAPPSGAFAPPTGAAATGVASQNSARVGRRPVGCNARGRFSHNTDGLGRESSEQHCRRPNAGRRHAASQFIE